MTRTALMERYDTDTWMSQEVDSVHHGKLLRDFYLEHCAENPNFSMTRENYPDDPIQPCGAQYFILCGRLREAPKIPWTLKPLPPWIANRHYRTQESVIVAEAYVGTPYSFPEPGIIQYEKNQPIYRTICLDNNGRFHIKVRRDRRAPIVRFGNDDILKHLPEQHNALFETFVKLHDELTSRLE